VLDGFGAAIDPRLQDGAAEVARPATLFQTGLEQVPAELADRLLGGHVQQAGRLRIEIADAAVFIDRINTLDDAAENGLGLGLTPT
jgi:hypothetical protein